MRIRIQKLFFIGLILTLSGIGTCPAGQEVEAYVTNLKLFGPCYAREKPEFQGVRLPNTFFHKNPMAVPAGNREKLIYIYCANKQIGSIPAGDTKRRIICDWQSKDSRCNKVRDLTRYGDVLTWDD